MSLLAVLSLLAATFLWQQLSNLQKRVETLEQLQFLQAHA